MNVDIKIKEDFNRLTQKERRKWVCEIKAERGCAICGEKRSNCLIFHHLDQKTKTMQIGSAIAGSMPLSRISTEIGLCTVLCSNCHLLLHAGDICPTSEMLDDLWKYVQ